MANENFYDLLGVAKTATKEEIKKAYRKKAIEHHPDRHKNDPKAEEKFKTINEAYSVLSDTAKRRNYDKFGSATPGSTGGGSGYQNFSGGMDFSDIFQDAFSGEGIFESFFGNGTGRSRRKSSPKGTDLKYSLDISLEDAFLGKKTEIVFNRKSTCDDCKGSGGRSGSMPSTCSDCGGNGQIRQSRGVFSVTSTCPRCRGEGRVVSNPCSACSGTGVREKRKKINFTIPQGINDGQTIRIQGEGEAIARGENGDLYVAISLKPHSYFKREDNDLLVELPISVTQAVLGGSIFVRAIDDKKLKLKISTGTQSSSILRISGAGMPILNTGGARGSLKVKLILQVPKRVSGKVKQLYEEISKLNGEIEEPEPCIQQRKSRSFFGF